MKAAVYAGTRNLYLNMVTAAKSLAMNSSVDEIWFLIEDSRFPEKLPDYVRCLDVSGQIWFSKTGNNVYKLWTWMVLMRTAIPIIFPEYDKMLSLDVDTIVNQNIDELWDLDLTDYYLAGVPEPIKSKPGSIYINAGVMMMNLKKFRDDKMADKVIASLNKDRYRFPDQDCLNLFCSGHIFPLSSVYNANNYTEKVKEPKIYHYATDRQWTTKDLPQQYKRISWNEIRRSV